MKWPIKSKNVTYIVGSPKTIALFKKKKNAENFVKDLKKFEEVPVRTTIKFMANEEVDDQFLYILDHEGVQLVIQIEREGELDIMKYDA